ncbi:DoxX family protein [Glycomyces harbinensis]|uniref:DoxX-like family protein n=1 Tax=Glycomyces harbinensis TaxID=58114 RepID=A0A1G6RJ03_9ACTN|nr:DoxX family protein [Glycomyces harbinensis]SDD04354.1 DoxX-like family protein [Glycomyces harbinensis]
MSTLYLVLALTAGALNLGSGIGSIARLKVIYPLLDGAHIPHSMLVFPIGTLKVLGGAGLLIGLAVPPIGTAAAAGLVLFWTCAVHSHVLANFWPKETFLTFTFLGTAIATLALDLALA